MNIEAAWSEFAAVLFPDDCVGEEKKPHWASTGNVAGFRRLEVVIVSDERTDFIQSSE